MKLKTNKSTFKRIKQLKKKLLFKSSGINHFRRRKTKKQIHSLMHFKELSNKNLKSFSKLLP